MSHNNVAPQHNIINNTETTSQRRKAVFQWIGRSKRTREILNDMYSTITKSQQQRANREIEKHISKHPITPCLQTQK